MDQLKTIRAVVKKSLSREAILHHVKKSYLLSGLSNPEVKLLRHNGFDPVCSALLPSSMQFCRYGAIAARWKNGWPKIHLDSIRSIPNWEDLVSKIIDEELDLMFELPDLSLETVLPYWNSTSPNPSRGINSITMTAAKAGRELGLEVARSITKRIIRELWLPTVISRLQARYRAWYYAPGNPGALRVQHHFHTLEVQRS